MLVARLTRRASALRRHVSACSALNQLASAGPGTPMEPLTIPTPEGVDKIFSPKLEKIASEISTLNILEVSELSQLLKRKLNLPDQPMMAMGNFAMAPASNAENAEDEVAPAQKVQTEFTVKMISFDEKQKVALIKEIKNQLEGFNLVQAKKFVESLPSIIKANITKEEADKYKEAFTKVGAEVKIE